MKINKLLSIAIILVISLSCISTVSFAGTEGEYVKLTGTAFGFEPASWSGGINAPFDGTTGTFYAATTSGTGYVGLDFGENKKYTIAKIVYASRANYGSRMLGAYIEGSNDGTEYETIYQISATPGSATLTTAYVTPSKAYRYVRYRGIVSNGYSDISELQLFTRSSSTNKINTSSYNTILTGSDVSAFSDPQYKNNAFDNDLTNFVYDKNNAPVILDIGTNMPTLSKVTFWPRSTFESNMANAKFYASSDGTNYDLVATAPASLTYQAYTLPINSQFKNNKYRYLKMECALAANCTRVSEIIWYGNYDSISLTGNDTNDSLNSNLLVQNNTDAPVNVKVYTAVYDGTLLKHISSNGGMRTIAKDATENFIFPYIVPKLSPTDRVKQICVNADTMQPAMPAISLK